MDYFGKVAMLVSIFPTHVAQNGGRDQDAKDSSVDNVMNEKGARRKLTVCVVEECP